jgi:hypothetical protein
MAYPPRPILGRARRTAAALLIVVGVAMTAPAREGSNTARVGIEARTRPAAATLRLSAAASRLEFPFWEPAMSPHIDSCVSRSVRRSGAAPATSEDGGQPMRGSKLPLMSLGRTAALAVTVVLSLAVPGAAGPVVLLEGGRPIVEACQSATLDIDAARERLAASDDYLPLAESARAHVTAARDSASDLDWPRELRRDHASLRVRLTAAHRALGRTDDARLAGRVQALDRLLRVASRNVIAATTLLEDNVPPALANKDDPPAPPVNAPVVAPAFAWTDFTPSPDTRRVFVSSSAGSDSNDGLSEATPVKSIWKGYTLLRDGYPDWLLLKRGDTFTTGRNVDRFGPPPLDWGFSFGKSGRSSSERLLVSSYGSGSRPYIKCNPDESPIWFQDPVVRYVAFVGLNFKSYTRDPDSPEFQGPAGKSGINALYAEDVLFEDCRFSYFGGHAIQSCAAFTLRGCVISDNYATVGHSQGLYTNNVKGLVVEGCAFIRNGWNPKVPGAQATVYNRNLYISNTPGTVVRDCIDADGASGGMQLRIGGTCERNLVVRAPLGISFSHPENPKGVDVTGVIRQNVILGGRNIDILGRGTGISIGTSAVDTSIYENIIANNTDGTENVAGIVFNGEDIETRGGIDVRDNIVRGWEYGGRGTCIGFFMSPTRSLRLRSVTVRNNKFEQIDARVVGGEALTGLEGATFTGNRYFSGRADGEWVRFAGLDYSLDMWLAQTGEPATARGATQFPDPGRGIASYMQTLGRPASIDEFLAQVRNQSRDNWRPEYTARNVINYVREGFGWAPIPTE